MPIRTSPSARLLLALGALGAVAPALRAQSAQDATADYYGSFADYAQLGYQTLERRLHDGAGADRTGFRGASAGYLFADVSTPDEFDIERQDGFVGGELPVGDVTLGLVLSFGSGETSMPGADADADGVQGLLYATKPFGEKFTGYATLGYGAYDFDARRATLFGTATGSTDATAHGLGAGATYLALKQEKFSVTARAGLRYEAAEVDGFTESGPLDAQSVDDLSNRQLILDLGAAATWNLTLAGRALDLVLTAGVEAPLVDDRDEVRATFVNTGTLYTNSFEDAEVSASLGANVAYQVCPSGQIFAGVEGRAGGNEGLYGLLGARVAF